MIDLIEPVPAAGHDPKKTKAAGGREIGVDHLRPKRAWITRTDD